MVTLFPGNPLDAEISPLPWVCQLDLAHLRYSDLAHPLETFFMT